MTTTLEAIEYYKLVIATFDARLRGRKAQQGWFNQGSLKRWEKKLYDEAKRLLKEAQP